MWRETKDFFFPSASQENKSRQLLLGHWKLQNGRAHMEPRRLLHPHLPAALLLSKLTMPSRTIFTPVRQPQVWPSSWLKHPVFTNNTTQRLIAFFLFMILYISKNYKTGNIRTLRFRVKRFFHFFKSSESILKESYKVIRWSRIKRV